MAELALFTNPGRTGKKRKKKRGTRAKKGKVPAHLKKYLFKKKRKGVTSMAKKKRRKARRNPINLVANPKRRRRLSAARKRNPIRYSKRSRRRRNPIGIGKFNISSFMKHTLVPSAVGAAGALSLDILLSYLPLPAMLKTPAVRPVIRLAGAVAVGMLAGAIMGRKTGEQVTAGAATVILYDTLKGFLSTAMPTLPLQGLGDGDYDDSSYYPAMGYAGAGSNAGIGMGEYVDGMGMYVSQPVSVT